MTDPKTPPQEINDELWCQYSDLPSPLAYADCDYDGMGNQGRVPGKLTSNK
jgi:hypothetical protein